MNQDNTSQPLPAAQDAGQIAVSAEDLQTQPPQIPLPLTSSTGTGFNAPDAGTGMPGQQQDASANSAEPISTASHDSATTDDKDALAGEKAGAGSQANAEAVSSTGPIVGENNRSNF